MLNKTVMHSLPLVFLSLWLCLFDQGRAIAGEQQAAFAVEVPAQAWKAVRLKNLPKGVAVSLKVKSSASLIVLVLTELDYSHFPKVKRPMFVSPIEQEIAFSVTTASAGHHYVVLDNRKGNKERSVALAVKAQQSTSRPRRAVREKLQMIESQLNSFMERVHRAIQFDPVPLKLGSCPKLSIMYRRQEPLILCVEWAKALQEIFPGKGLATDMLVVSLFHELAHLMLREWKQPLAENEDMADELATTLMVMFRLDARVRAAMGHYRDHPEALEALGARFKHDRHLVSNTRAREMLQWVNDPNQVAKWQSILIPHLQTVLLRQLSKRPERWTDRVQVKAELAKRQLEGNSPQKSSSSSSKELTF